MDMFCVGVLSGVVLVLAIVAGSAIYVSEQDARNGGPRKW